TSAITLFFEGQPMLPLVRHILWAEDRDRVYERCERVLTSYLDKHGIPVKVYRAVDGNAVFRLLYDDSIRIDLVVLDLEMEHFNGLMTISEMARRGLAERLMVVSVNLGDERFRRELDVLAKKRIILGAFDTRDEDDWCAGILKVLSCEPARILHFSDLHFGK